MAALSSPFSQGWGTDALLTFHTLSLSTEVSRAPPVYVLVNLRARIHLVLRTLAVALCSLSQGQPHPLLVKSFPQDDLHMEERGKRGWRERSPGRVAESYPIRAGARTSGADGLRAAPRVESAATRRQADAGLLQITHYRSVVPLDSPSADGHYQPPRPIITSNGKTCDL